MHRCNGANPRLGQQELLDAVNDLSNREPNWARFILAIFTKYYVKKHSEYEAPISKQV